MSHEVLWWPVADEALTRLEHDEASAPLLRAIQRTLARLESDPYDRGLATRQFRTDRMRHVRATPVPGGAWHLLWQPGATPRTIEIVAIVEFDL
jgi:hypothetical protein